MSYGAENLVDSVRHIARGGPKEQRPWGSDGKPSSTAAEHRSKMVSVICLDTPIVQKITTIL
ncbi:MAG TPA: hypothetical protein VMG10_27800, partial [Gemmataceae bacterium]|nr:hypothetical protein [Gemmataceae bacterium]